MYARYNPREVRRMTHKRIADQNFVWVESLNVTTKITVVYTTTPTSQKLELYPEALTAVPPIMKNAITVSNVASTMP